MTIAERINLHKCGYTKEEITALIAEEKQAVEKPVETVDNPEPQQQPEHAQPQNAEILTAINNLTKAIQAQNIQNAQQKAPEIVKAEDVLTGALKNL